MTSKTQSMAAGLLAILALAAAPATSQQRRAIAGIYAGVPIAYDEASGVVSGYFSETTGRGQFSCIFYFSGHLQGNSASITSYFPEDPADRINGSLTLGSDGKLEIRLSEDPGGCWNVRHFADRDQPADFELGALHPAWIAIDVVKSGEAHFYADAKEAGRKRSYLVQGDAVAILGRKSGWILVEYVNDGKSTSGYLKRSDLYGLSEAPSAVASSLR